jgi:phosphoribosylanthranilate isomerase
MKVIHCGGNGINALQLDMIWPDPQHVANAVSGSGKNLEVILQIGKKALEQVSTTEEIVERLYAYKGIIHYVLLDKSMGKGEGMDAVEFIPVARAIKDAFPEIGIVVAGGLGPKTMELIVPLVREFHDISWDAQGQLRSSGNALDPIEWDRAEEYVIKSLMVHDFV